MLFVAFEIVPFKLTFLLTSAFFFKGTVVQGPGLRVFSLGRSCRFAAIIILEGAAPAPLEFSPLSSYTGIEALDRAGIDVPSNHVMLELFHTND